MEVPRTLRTWLLVHAAVSVASGLPLLVAPEQALGRLGWTSIDPVSARLLGAALLAIGAQSFFARDASVEVTRSVLRLNLVWSLAAAAGLFVGVGANAPNAAWIALSTQIAFAGVWLHHAIRFKQLERVAGLDEAEPPVGAEDENDENDTV
jgi:hypothetical protein